MRISPALEANCHKTPEREAWLGRLPQLIERLTRRWGVTADAPLDGEEATCSYVAAVRCGDGTPAVLKIAMPHMEQEHEAEGLRFWAGDPTVRLLASDDEQGAMLLERCLPGTTIRSLEEEEQDVVIAGLLRRLWRRPTETHRFRPLSALMEHWAAETLRQTEQWLDAGLVREGLRLLRELPRTADSEVLLATDLHAGNVLCAEREPRLVIDPKPFVGDPAYDATQHLFNCWARLQARPSETIRRFATLLGVDQERVRLWTFARAAAEPRDCWTREDLEFARALAM